MARPADEETDQKPGNGDDPFEIDPGAAFAGDDEEREDEGDRGRDLPPVAGLEPELFELLDEETVRSFLTAGGAAAHGLAAIDKDSDEWVFLRPELDAIAPPLTRILNRYPALAAAASAYGDPAVVALGMGTYAKRSLAERASSRAKQELATDDEHTGNVTFHLRDDE